MAQPGADNSWAHATDSRCATDIHIWPAARPIIRRLTQRSGLEGRARGSVICMGRRGFRIDSNQVLSELVRNQSGLISRAQLNEQGAGPSIVAAQIAADRWRAVGSNVVATFTGPLPTESTRWAALLHTGPASALCGRSALEVRGLTGWSSETVQVIVDRGTTPEDLDGVRIHESRRHRGTDVSGANGLACHSVERAAVDVAAWCMSDRTAVGVLAAVAQQRLTTPARLQATLERQGRIRRRRLIAATINDLAGGAQALSEIEYGRLFERWGLPRPTSQAIRLDHRGRRRYLDVEWTLPDGGKKALEIDGVGHLEPTRWYSDLLRAADITATDETPILRLPATAARIDQELVAGILHRYLGLDHHRAA